MSSEACTKASAARGAWAAPMPLSPEAARKLVEESLLATAQLGREVAVPGGRAYLAPGVELGADRPFVCAIGAFDGLHLGHRALVAAAREDAHRRGVPLAVVTFDPDPAEVLSSRSPERLLQDEDRVRALASLGPDAVVVHDFTRSFSQLGYEAYVKDVLSAAARPVSLHVGTNFTMGRGGAGSPTDLAALGERMGFDVTGHDLVADGGEAVSATRVRRLLRAGGEDGLATAARLLGRCPYVRGVVEHGRGEGTGFGFPTANVTLDPRDCVPAQGVYACWYVGEDGRAWSAAVNVGEPPTFSTDARPMLEANLVGFSGDLYGATARVVFVRWLRGSRRFDSLEELERTVLGNIDWVRQNLGGSCVEVPACAEGPACVGAGSAPTTSEAGGHGGRP